MLTSLLASSILLHSLQAQPVAEAATTDTEAPADEAVVADNADSAATEDSEAAPQPEAATDENRIICRRTQVIGSKFTKRMCGTQAEWDELARRGQSNTRDFQDRGQSIRQAGQ